MENVLWKIYVAGSPVEEVLGKQMAVWSAPELKAGIGPDSTSSLSRTASTVVTVRFHLHSAKAGHEQGFTTHQSPDTVIRGAFTEGHLR